MKSIKDILLAESNNDKDDNKVLDYFGTELKAGDTVCFVEHISRGAVKFFKAKVSDVKCIPSKYEHDPAGKYVFLDEKTIESDYDWNVKIPKRKNANLVVKCY